MHYDEYDKEDTLNTTRLCWTNGRQCQFEYETHSQVKGKELSIPSKTLPVKYPWIRHYRHGHYT
jgi:hypothetical protein